MIFTLITIIGWLALIGGTVATVVAFLGLHEKVKLTKTIPIIVVGLILVLFKGMFYYQQAGYNVLIQYPTGKQICHTKAGPHLLMFGNVTPMRKFIPVQITKSIRFNDSVTADAEVAVRFELSKDEEECKTTIKSFRTEAKLMKQTLIPLSKAALRNSARLLSAQEYVAGGGGKLEQVFRDQLSEGLYILEKVRVVNAKTKKKVGDKDIETDDEKQVTYKYRIKLDKNGLPVRTKRSTDKYGIIVSQALISSVDPSKKFKTKLDNQMAESARGALEREKTKSLQFEKEKEQAQGELDKVKQKLEAEKGQIKGLVASKAKKQQATNDLAAVKINEKVEMRKANIVKMKADAEAYAKKKVMLADGALEKKLDAYVKSVEAMASALTNKQLVPQIVITGGGKQGGSNATDLINLMTAKFAKDLNVNVKPDTK